MATEFKILSSGELVSSLEIISFPSSKVKKLTVQSFTICNTHCGPITINVAISRFNNEISQKIIHNMVLNEGDTLSLLDGGAEIVLEQGEAIRGSSDVSGVAQFIIMGLEEK